MKNDKKGFFSCSFIIQIVFRTHLTNLCMEFPSDPYRRPGVFFFRRGKGGGEGGRKKILLPPGFIEKGGGGEVHWPLYGLLIFPGLFLKVFIRIIKTCAW